MVERHFEDAERAKAVGFSHGNFGLVVQTLDDAAGNQFLRTEIIEDEFPVLTQRAGDLLHGFDAGAHGLATPLVEELAGPGRRVVIPELLKHFLEEVDSLSRRLSAEEFLLLGSVSGDGFCAVHLPRESARYRAVKTQIWIAVSVYVLVAIVRKRLGLEASLYQILLILSLSLFEKMPILQALQPSDSTSELLEPGN